MMEDKDESPIGLLRRFWYRLTEPPASIKWPVRRRQARLLSSLLVAFIPLAVLIALTLALPNLVRPAVPLLQNPDFCLTMSTAVLFAITYGLNRAGHYTLAAALTVGTISIAVFAIAIAAFAGLNPYYDSTEVGVLAYLILPVLFASVLLPMPATVIVATINVIGMLLVPMFFPQITLAAIVGESMSFVLPVYIFIPLAAQHRNRLETARRAELIEKEEQHRSLLEITFEGIVISKDGKLVDANTDFARMFGYSPSEVIGMSLLDFIAEDSRAPITRTVEAGIEQPVESLGLRKDGTEFHVELVTKSLTHQGRAVQVTAIRDITERKQTEQALRQQSREMELLNQVGRVLGSTLDLNQVLVTVLEEVRRLLGVIAASVWLIDPETDELVCQQAVGHQSDVVRGWRLAPGEGIAGKVAASGKSLIMPDTRADERHFKKVDQQTGVDHRSILSVPLQVKEQVIGVLQMLDTEVDRFRPTDLRLVESLAATAAMAIENARLYEETEGLRAFNENIVQNMNEGILLEDATGHITFVNPKCAEILGYTPEELAGRHWKTTVAPENVAQIEEEMAQRPQDTASQYETVLLTRDGRRVPVIISARPLVEDGQFNGVLSVFADITERKRAEDEIRRRAAQQEALNAIITAAAVASDLHELLETVLDHTLQALGLDIGAIWVGDQSAIRGLSSDLKQVLAKTAQATGLDTHGTIAVEDLQQVEAAPHIAGFGVRAVLTVPILAEGRRIGRLSLAASAPRTWPAEEIALVEAVGRQLGGAIERLRLMEKTWEQARQMQRIMDTVPAGMLLLDSDLHVLMANPAAREHLAILCDAGVGAALTHLGGRPIEQLLTPPSEGLWHEVRVDGLPPRTFEMAAYKVESGAGMKNWVLVLRDVTQEREIEKRTQRQERLAVVGQLAAGIAHDFNNIMSVIILYAEMILKRPTLFPQDHERLATISQQAKSATNLIGQILDFSRTSVIERHPLGLTPFLKELVRLLERTLPENIELGLAYGHDEYTVNADPTRIQQVVMNLAVNARDAMLEGGELCIELKRIRVGPGEPPPLPEMEPGEWVQVTVSDTGTGISPDALPHIFDPFFTTKAPGQGTGLGLAQVYGIVGQHEGHIDVESEVGRGTTFVIYLPALQVPGVKPSELGIGTPAQGRGETILVVEDDSATREAVANALQSLGYRALVAADGQEAVAIFEQHGDETTLVLSDLMIPGTSDTELFRILKQKNPAVKIVVMTGYPQKMTSQDLPRRDVVDWLQKPLSMEQLAEAVKRVLEA